LFGFNLSIEFRFAWSPQELAVFITLAIQGSNLTITIFQGIPTLERVSKKLDVGLLAF
jgi:hypothetical protein